MATKTLSRYFKTAKRLQVAIDNADSIDGMRNYLDSIWAYSQLDLDNETSPTWSEVLNQGKLFPIPWWALEGIIKYYSTGEVAKIIDETEFEDMICQLVYGYPEAYKYGETIELNGKKYLYLVSLPLSQEEEHQADDGQCVYEYRRYSFLRVLKEV